MDYDIIIVGGGPSGLMASIAASQHNHRVLLLDKGNKLGRKLRISGGGRCNVTNAKPLDELIQNIPGNGKFLYSAFSLFNNQDIIRFFEGLGIQLKEEDRGRMFPVSDNAKTVVDALINQVKQQGVDIQVNCPVSSILYDEEAVRGVQLASGERILSRCVVIATGGKSVPHTGSTGDGYHWAKEAGHTITDLYPTEVPLTSREPWIANKSLQGLSLRNITLTVWNEKEKPVITHEGDVIFTHFGLSGPAALRCSQFVVKLLKQNKQTAVKVTVDLFPEQNASQLEQKLLQLLQASSKKAIKNVLKAMLPDRMIPVLLQTTDIDENTTYNHLPKLGLKKLVTQLKDFPIYINGTLSIEEAFVTGGGIHLKEVHPKTMESKRKKGLFFCGEILDVHGYTGGFNITAAFSTGYTAGYNAVLSLYESNAE